jgi:hypothetical protein
LPLGAARGESACREPLRERPFRFSCQGCRGGCCRGAATALSDLNQLANDPYMAYVKRKLGKWYREAPRPARKHWQPAIDADETAPAANDQEEAAEADALSGGGDGSGFELD